jgi:hypothetical protein
VTTLQKISARILQPALAALSTVFLLNYILISETIVQIQLSVRLIGFSRGRLDDSAVATAMVEVFQKFSARILQPALAAVSTVFLLNHLLISETIVQIPLSVRLIGFSRG